MSRETAGIAAYAKGMAEAAQLAAERKDAEAWQAERNADAAGWDERSTVAYHYAACDALQASDRAADAASYAERAAESPECRAPEAG